MFPSSLQSFVAKLRHRKFCERVEREILMDIFTQIQGEADRGYPFNNAEELRDHNARIGGDAKKHFAMLEDQFAQLPEAYGQAFRYIVYRDLDARMQQYLELARRRVQPETCDPRFVATAAQVA